MLSRLSRMHAHASTPNSAQPSRHPDQTPRTHPPTHPPTHSPTDRQTAGTLPLTGVELSPVLTPLPLPSPALGRRRALALLAVRPSRRAAPLGGAGGRRGLGYIGNTRLIRRPGSACKRGWALWEGWGEVVGGTSPGARRQRKGCRTPSRHPHPHTHTRAYLCQTSHRCTRRRAGPWARAALAAGGSGPTPPALQGRQGSKAGQGTQAARIVRQAGQGQE